MKIDRSNQWHQSIESAESVVVGTARRGRIADETKDRSDGKNDSRIGARTDDCARLSRRTDDDDEEC